MQCAPVAASVFALRQALAGFASVKFPRRYAEGSIDDVSGTTAHGAASVAPSGNSFACSVAVDRERMDAPN
jgi:hypothetical protein